MGKVIRKIIILVSVFFAALMIYFIWSKNTNKETEVVYTALEEPALPVIYISVFHQKMNRLYGYLQEMSVAASRETLTVLPEDRMIRLGIEQFDGEIKEIRYEIRNLSLDQLVERTAIEDWQDDQGVRTLNLSIPNLLERDQEYLLHLYVETGEFGTIHYYTRIVWGNSTIAQSMLELAVEFSDKTLDYDRARDLVTYLESNETADNSTLGRVTLESSYYQLTWGGLKVSRVGEMQVSFKELDGIMGQLEVEYIVSEGEGERQRFYDVRDFYTMKWNAQRIYMMDYYRETNQIFDGDKSDYSGKRILLGIENEDRVQVKKSDDGQRVVYVVNRDLWCYDQTKGLSKKIFSFRDNLEDIRNSYGRHNIKIVSVTEEGNVYFLLYGYMNRGNHQGNIGVTLYLYNYEQETLEEKFFIPTQGDYNILDLDIQKLAYLGSNHLFYLMLDHAIYGIDINSNEYFVVAQELGRQNCAVSQDGQYVAWQDQGNQPAISWMDLETGVVHEINEGAENLLNIVGFVGHDFVYGLSSPQDEQLIHSGKSEYMIHALKIVDRNLEEITRYEQSGKFLSDVKIADGRVHITRLQKNEDGRFRKLDQDTIVCSEDIGEQSLEGIGWYASGDRGRVYFVQLDQDANTKEVTKTASIKKLITNKSANLNIVSGKDPNQMYFYAYERGKLKGVTEDFSEAVAMAYEFMGTVIDSHHEIVWNRVNRRSHLTIENPLAAVYPLLQQLDNFNENKYYNDLLILDASNCTLQQMFYMVDKGIPVVVYINQDEYLLICGYDTQNISIYDPRDGQVYKMPIPEATEYFSELKNDFICGILIR